MVDANVTGDASTERPERSKPLRTGSTVYIDMETESWSHDRFFFQKSMFIYVSLQTRSTCIPQLSNTRVSPQNAETSRLFFRPSWIRRSGRNGDMTLEKKYGPCPGPDFLMYSDKPSIVYNILYCALKT